jgi:hypothetical protein
MDDQWITYSLSESAHNGGYRRSSDALDKLQRVTGCGVEKDPTLRLPITAGLYIALLAMAGARITSGSNPGAPI